MRKPSLETPYLMGLTWLVAVPAVGALVLAVTDFSGVQGPRFTGFANFARLAGDDLFWTSLASSAVYVLVAVPVRLVAAVAFAVLLQRDRRGAGTARTIAFLPSVIPDAAYALLWLWILNPLYGPLSAGLAAMGIPAPGWLTEPGPARIALGVVGAFQLGEAFVVALAARRAVPPVLYEAAAVEGASPWFSFRRITLPMMAPVLALLALRDVLLAFQTSFVPALVITGGGPRYATHYLPLYVYRTAFGHLRLGYASAMAVAMFAVTAAIVLAQVRVARRWRLV
ncbi:MAG: carbohydrate ABC transporter permease [Actinomycetota bacterium]